MKTTQFFTWLFAVWLLGALAVPRLPAQEREKPATSEEIDLRFADAVAEARKLSAAAFGKTISLSDALRITLVRQPVIRLAEDDLEIAKSVALSAAAPFDPTLIGEVRHGRFYRPLSDREIAQQNSVIQMAQDAVREQNSLLSDSQAASASADQLREQALVLDALVAPSTLSSVAAGDVVTSQQAQVQLAEARLDALLREPTSTTAREGLSLYSLGLSKLTRSGVIVVPNVDWVRTNDVENTATINLDLFVPLAQGRGAITERAVEDAARVDLEASKWQLRHEISRALYATAVAYWELLAAQQNFALLRSSEEISRSFSDLIDLRLKAEEITRGQAAIADSRLSDAISNRIGAELDVFRARQQLALAMGMKGEELGDPPYARGLLPGISDMESITSMDADQVIRKALILRDDQRAIIQMTRSGKILARAAKFDQKPVIDMFFNFAYTGVDSGTHFENTFSAFSDDKTGVGAFGGISMNWPLELSAARANFQRSEAIYRQRAVSAKDLERNIASNSRVAIFQTVSTRRQVKFVEQGANYSREALEGARVRLNEESSNLLAAIQLEEQYTDSLQQVIRAYLNHIVSVSTLRFETGTLLEPAAEYKPQAITIRADNLATIPNWSEFSDTPIQPIATKFDQAPRPLLKRKNERLLDQDDPKQIGSMSSKSVSPPMKELPNKEPKKETKPAPLLKKLFGKD